MPEAEAVVVEVLAYLSNRGRQGQQARKLLARPTVVRPPSVSSVMNLQRRLTTAEEQEVVRCYQDGATLMELANRLGVHRNTISRALERHGTSRRYRLVDEAALPELCRRYEAGESYQQLGAVLGVDPTTVRRALVKAGVRSRPRPGAGPPQLYDNRS